MFKNIIGFGLATILVGFLSGWTIRGWKDTNKIGDLEDGYAALSLEMSSTIMRLQREFEDKSAEIETQLNAQLAEERSKSEVLHDQIQAAQVIQQSAPLDQWKLCGTSGDPRKATESQCVALPSVDWRVFQEFYNAAAGGTSGDPRSDGSSATPSSSALRRASQPVDGRPPGKVGF